MDLKWEISLLIITALIGASLCQQYNESEVYSKCATLGQTHRCSNNHKLASSVVFCIDAFLNETKRKTTEAEQYCDFKRISWPYDVMSICVDTKSRDLSCHDPFQLFDSIFRKVIHPSLFKDCQPSNDQVDETHQTVAVVLLVVLATVSSLLISMLVYYRSAKC